MRAVDHQVIEPGWASANGRSCMVGTSSHQDHKHKGLEGERHAEQMQPPCRKKSI